MPISVFIVSDVRLYREGLHKLLADQCGLESRGVASSLQEALIEVLRVTPDVVLVDLAMCDSRAAIREIARARANAKVLAMGVSEAATEIVACAEAGAVGYVTRDSSVADLLRCVSAAVSGELSCSPRIAASLLSRINALSRSSESLQKSGLTRRENAILRLIDEGLSNKEIARQLNIGVSTVKNHVHSLLAKLNVARRAEAAAFLRRNPAA